MKKIFYNRVLPLILALVVMLSAVPVHASAVGIGDESGLDLDSVVAWTNHISNPIADFVNVIAQRFGCSPTGQYVYWHIIDGIIGILGVGEFTYNELVILCNHLNSWFIGNTVSDLYSDVIDKSLVYASKTLSACMGLGTVRFEVVEPSPTAGFYRIQDSVSGLWLVNSDGQYPCAPVDGVVSESNCWLPEDMFKSPYTLVSIEELSNMATDVGADIAWNDMYYYIYRDDGCLVYADKNGLPYAAFRVPDAYASQTDRPGTSAKDENGEDVELPEDFDANIDLENMLITLPDGTLSILDSVIYDESTKSYYVDSHDTYNTTNNYYYHWEYHINYTSITYIGQTEEYNKYYEVYYELPDGRDSADLTKEEVEQLNLSVDVIPYGRSADDVSLRSLYHFDGDTMDSSYWNYCTDFTWNEGASLTYMDAAVFEGALYLDENVHDFTLTLPSEIGSDDFTLQFRYYQSYTAAPQTDSYIQIGLSKIFQLSGGYYSDSAGKTLATTPVGTWNEVAIMRNSGTLYFYNNGVCIGSKSDSSFMNNQIRFYFGSAQQTYKYLDELRILNYALEAGGDSYTPTSVPHDTNLTLVLPDTTVPVADEYWKISFSDAAQLNLDFTNNNSSSLFNGNVSSYTALQSGKDGIAMMFKGISSSDISEYQTYISSSVFNPGPRLLKFGLDLSDLMPDRDHDDDKYYPVSVSAVMGDGNQYTLNFSVYHNGNPMHYDENGISVGTGSSQRVALTNGYLTADCNGSNEVFFVMDPRVSGTVIRAISVWVGDPVNSLSAVKFADTSIECEKISSITPMFPDQMKTPTLAVRTDLDITGYQIGGVRPSVPKNGMVWALVENERITSIQIYNGQAWEGVDGRIWTGSRWIPASSYNIVTLQDMYDIVDATQDYEYIYSESGFWDWWQKSWNAFTERLFSVLGSGGSGSDSPGADGGSGSDVLDDVDLDDEALRYDPSKEDSRSFWQFIAVVLSGSQLVVGGMRSLFSGFVSSVPASINTITGSFDDMGVVSSIMDGSYADPDATTFGRTQLYDFAEVDPWRYR